MSTTRGVSVLIGVVVGAILGGVVAQFIGGGPVMGTVVGGKYWRSGVRNTRSHPT